MKKFNEIVFCLMLYIDTVYFMVEEQSSQELNPSAKKISGQLILHDKLIYNQSRNIRQHSKYLHYKFYWWMIQNLYTCTVRTYVYIYIVTMKRVSVLNFEKKKIFLFSKFNSKVIAIPSNIIKRLFDDGNKVNFIKENQSFLHILILLVI